MKKLSMIVGYGALLTAALACSAGSEGGGKNGGTGASSSAGGNASSGGSLNLPTAGSTSLGGQITSSCDDPKSTKVSGKVYSPKGDLALYNVVVYVPVPGETQPVIPEGASCDKCSGSQARGVAVALTNEAGEFLLEGVPEGSNVPLVIQVGKWRREVTIPQVTACTTTVLSDPELTRLPRNQTEGHLPKIAMVTGHSDSLECLLRKLGISDTEFTLDSGTGRVNMFYGCASSSGLYGANTLAPELGGGAFADVVTSLYANPAKLATYDMLVLSCEGHGCNDQKTPEHGATLKGYADLGGRILFDHMHFRWFVNNSIEPWEVIGEFDTGEDFPDNTAFTVNTSFPKGAALSQWLVNVGATQTPGQLVIAKAQHSAKVANSPAAQPWVQGAGAIQYMSVNTPVEAATPADHCGRFIHTDLHVSGNSSSFSDQGTPFPNACDTGELTPEEKALAFMIFDLSSCVMEEGLRPEPPPVVK